MDAKRFIGEPRLLISQDALKTNLRTLRRHLAAEVKICAVLKANAYGHGARLVASLIQQIEAEEPFLRVSQYAVATFDEAADLADFGKPLMLLRPVENVFLGRQRELIESAIINGWTMTLASAAAADDIARVAVHLERRAHVQIMLDTGMTRCGCDAADFDSVLERVLHHASLRLTGISTHFVNSELAGDPMTSRQLRQYQSMLDRNPILDGIPRHAANSGAIFFTPRAHFDAVRPGISLYGIDPTGRPSVDRPLMPALRWTAPIIALHDVEPGQGIGYGHTWMAATSGRIAVVPVGYADGFPRNAGNHSTMMVAGIPCGVVGRVSMDMTAIDVSRIADIAVGDEVTVIDDNPLSPASIYSLASVCGTIPYEIVTGIGSRVQRCSVDLKPVEVESDV
jgi:alanine racemase